MFLQSTVSLIFHISLQTSPRYLLEWTESTIQEDSSVQEQFQEKKKNSLPSLGLILCPYALHFHTVPHLQSQNHRIFGAGNLWQSSNLNSCSEQGQLEQVAQNCAQSGFNPCEDGNFTTSLDDLFQCVTTLTINKKIIIIKKNLSYG